MIRPVCTPNMPLPYADLDASDIVVATGLPSGTVETLTKLAERIRPSTNGNVSPSPPPALLDKLTDQLLVVASDAVTAVAAAASPPLSGKATLRLLAWVLGDARGGGRPMEKALAETVGKRLEKQAQKVRETLAAATAGAAEAREAAHAAAAQDADLAAVLTTELATIDAIEQAAYTAARNEVYVGFHELGGESTPAQPPLAAPTYMTDSPPLEESDIPQSLAERLDKERADFLRRPEFGFYPFDLEPHGLPYVVRVLIGRLMHAESCKEIYQRQLQESRVDAEREWQERLDATKRTHERIQARTEAARDDLEAELHEAEAETFKLQRELQATREKLARAEGSVRHSIRSSKSPWQRT